MAIDAEAIAELFAAFGPVDVRGMFGAAGIFADGVFFALAEDGVIYLKGDDDTARRFVAEGCGRFTYRTRARTVETNLWRMPERLYDDPDELADWARQAHAVAIRSRMKKKKPRGKSAAKTSVERKKAKASPRRHSGMRPKARPRRR